ncbi:MAG: hypothetical protein KGH75_03340 [Rhodospirillales bacterium]|nr:hypothetical protein [Rhodospirillales bacterium]
MNKFLIACFAVSGFCGLTAAMAHAAPAQDTARPISVSSIAQQQPDDMPYRLAKLQTEVHTLGNIEGQAPGDAHYPSSVEPQPSVDGSPIPTGGSSPRQPGQTALARLSAPYE